MSKSAIPNRAELLLRVRNMVEVRLLHKVARKSAKILKELALNGPLAGLVDDRLAMTLAHTQRNRSAMAIVCRIAERA